MMLRRVVILVMVLGVGTYVDGYAGVAAYGVVDADADYDVNDCAAAAVNDECVVGIYICVNCCCAVYGYVGVVTDVNGYVGCYAGVYTGVYDDGYAVY